MIKEKELVGEFHGRIRVEFEGGTFDLSAVQNILTQEAEKCAIPIAFSMDEIKTGGLFNSSTENCLVLSHPDHQNDYNKICIRIKTQGTYAFLSFYEFGHSMWRIEQANQENITSMRHGTLSERLFSSVLSSGNGASKLQDEMDWYSIINQLIDNIFA